MPPRAQKGGSPGVASSGPDTSAVTQPDSAHEDEDDERQAAGRGATSASGPASYETADLLRRDSDPFDDDEPLDETKDERRRRKRRERGKIQRDREREVYSQLQNQEHELLMAIRALKEQHRLLDVLKVQEIADMWPEGVQSLRQAHSEVTEAQKTLATLLEHTRSEPELASANEAALKAYENLSNIRQELIQRGSHMVDFGGSLSFSLHRNLCHAIFGEIPMSAWMHGFLILDKGNLSSAAAETCTGFLHSWTMFEDQLRAAMYFALQALHLQGAQRVSHEIAQRVRVNPANNSFMLRRADSPELRGAGPAAGGPPGGAPHQPAYPPAMPSQQYEAGSSSAASAAAAGPSSPQSDPTAYSLTGLLSNHTAEFEIPVFVSAMERADARAGDIVKAAKNELQDLPPSVVGGTTPQELTLEALPENPTEHLAQLLISSERFIPLVLRNFSHSVAPSVFARFLVANARIMEAAEEGLKADLGL